MENRARAREEKGSKFAIGRRTTRNAKKVGSELRDESERSKNEQLQLSQCDPLHLASLNILIQHIYPALIDERKPRLKYVSVEPS